MNSPDRFQEVCTRIKHCSPALRLFFTFLVMSVLISSWYMFFYCPISSAIAFYTNQKDILSAKKGRLSRIAKTVERLPGQVKQLEQEIEGLSKILEREENAVLEKILAIFKKHSIALESCKKGEKEEGDAGFCLVVYECSIEGKYENVINSLQTIEALYPSAACLCCQLTKTQMGCAGLLIMRVLTKPFKKVVDTVDRKKTKKRKA